jgi:GNAT superfamily N-acetyltransferase
LPDLADVCIRPMAAADVEAAIRAILAGGWGDRRASLQFFIRHPRAHPFVAEVGGEIIGTAVAAHNGRTGWVGLVFVSPSLRGRGLGSLLTGAVVDCLKGLGCRGILLVATDLGRPVYDRLGFRVDGEYAEFSGPSLPGIRQHPRVRRLEAEDLPEICAVDQKASGEDRSHLIDAIHDGWVVADGGSIRGYALRTPWGLGPVIADNPAAGALLMDVIRGQAPAGRMTIHTARANTAALVHLRATGFQEQRRCARMVLGEPAPWRPDHIWTIFSFALG